MKDPVLPDFWAKPGFTTAGNPVLQYEITRFCSVSIYKPFLFLPFYRFSDNFIPAFRGFFRPEKPAHTSLSHNTGEYHHSRVNKKPSDNKILYRKVS